MHILASNKFLILHRLTAECRLHRALISFGEGVQREAPKGGGDAGSGSPGVGFCICISGHGSC